jgi:hypothetical protein
MDVDIFTRPSSISAPSSDRRVRSYGFDQASSWNPGISPDLLCIGGCLRTTYNFDLYYRTGRYEIARNSVESQRLSTLIRYATAAPLACGAPAHGSAVYEE